MPQWPCLSYSVAIMPVDGPFSQVTLARHKKRRLGDLEAVVAASLAERYEAQLQTDGSILLVLAGGVTRPPVGRTTSAIPSV